MTDTQRGDVVLAIFAEDDVDVDVDRVPAGFPESLIPTHPVRVIGGAHQRGTLTSVFAYPASQGDAVQLYVDFVRRMEWTETDMKMGGPFGPTSFIVLERHHTSLVVRRGPRSDMEAVVVVSRGPEGGAFGLDDRGRPSFGEIVIPRMQPLENAQFVSGGGGSGGGDHVESHERLITPTAPSGIVAHYVSQLGEHGWTAGELCVSAPGCVQWVSAYDRRGRAWTGTLRVQSIGAHVEICVHMALVHTNHM